MRLDSRLVQLGTIPLASDALHADYGRMKLWAIADLHLSHPGNSEVLDTLPSHPDDWLVVAGDVTNGHRHLDQAFKALCQRFHTVVWVPGNHDLWSRPNEAGEPRGMGLYHRLVDIAQRHGVVTPEDPYPIFPHPTGDILIAPLFLHFDYSFRPDHVHVDDVLRWARETNINPVDERMLHCDPFPDHPSWCSWLCAVAEKRLSACPPDLPKILINHYPLEQSLAVLPRVPRFTPWCGTRLSRGWHVRFNACAVIYGHLHIRRTVWLDGVPFQEVSLGYPGQWDPAHGVPHYLQEVQISADAPVEAGQGAVR